MRGKWLSNDELAASTIQGSNIVRLVALRKRADSLKQQRDELLTLCKEVQGGCEFTPELCKRMDEVIEKVEATK